jgi:hypothetical protein
MINERQKQLFHALKIIKDGYVGISLSKLQNGLKTIDLEEQQNEIIESVLYSVMELIDGYNENINFPIDLIEKDTGQSLKGDIQLHDKFMDFLNEVENE